MKQPIEELLNILNEFLASYCFRLILIDQEIASNPESNWSWAEYSNQEKSIRFYFKYHCIIK